MEPWQIALIIVGGVLLALLLFVVIPMICITMPIAEKLYKKQWTRSKEFHFDRGCSDPTVPFHLDMYNQGIAWREENKNYIKEVSITSDGLKLFGEYYDFGYKKAIMLLPGRTETCFYGCYYAPAFKKAGYNILLTDPRGHGLSEGDKITLGKGEGLDAINWCKFLHNEMKIETIALYGLCGGATACCVALTDPTCPNYINAMIADGMFYSFFNVYRRHIIDEKHPVFPVIWEVLGKIKKRNGVDPYKITPKALIKNVKVPTLFLSGEKDIFAVPEEAKKLLDLCGSNDKKLVYISNARHSHLRYDNTEEYDKAVVEFLKTH